MYKLEAIHIHKKYPGTIALDDVSLGFEGGKVHALIGKNGAGKSTLVKILAGSLAPTRGEIRVDGIPVPLRSPSDAFNRGIATVYQELSLVPGLSVAENILLGRMPKRRGPLIDWVAAYAQAEQTLVGMQVQLEVRQPVEGLSFAQQQMVEIAKAMSCNPSVLMLDEPTSALSRHETQSLFYLVRQLANTGVAIIYISHRLQELREIADRATVLRDGVHVGTVEMAETTSQEIIHLMFGETVQRERPTDLLARREPLLEVRDLSREDHFQEIDLTLHEGEILGIAGMLGSGRTELLRAIFGADPFDRGQIRVLGQRVRSVSPATMKELGVAFTPEDRKNDGLVQSHSIRSNLCLASMNQIATRGFITRAREQVVVNEQVRRLSIKIADSEQAVSSLSGGNQQKVVVGNWLSTRPRIILFDEPTRGIDVQAKQQIFQVMWDLSREGLGCIFVSSEVEELLQVCHRILIMQHGKIVDEVLPSATTPEGLIVQCMED